jgi:hypothetical protein
MSMPTRPQVPTRPTYAQLLENQYVLLNRIRLLEQQLSEVRQYNYAPVPKFVECTILSVEPASANQVVEISTNRV